MAAPPPELLPPLPERLPSAEACAIASWYVYNSGENCIMAAAAAAGDMPDVPPAPDRPLSS